VLPNSLGGIEAKKAKILGDKHFMPTEGKKDGEPNQVEQANQTLPLAANLGERRVFDAGIRSSAAVVERLAV
jgi:hypothetical protein